MATNRKFSELGVITTFDDTSADCLHVYVPGEATAFDQNKRMTIDSVFQIVREIPQDGSDKTSSYTLVLADSGKTIGVGTGGSITIPDAVFSGGEAITIENNTSGDITITCTITTAYISGTDSNQATVTLATRGLCTIKFRSGTECKMIGSIS